MRYDASELEALLTEFAEKLQEPASDDLEEAADKYGKEETILPEYYNDGDIPDYEKWTADAFNAGAKWDREQMMKDAVEGEIIGFPKDIKGSFVRFPVYALKEVAHFPINGKVGDKVKVIIIKE